MVPSIVCLYSLQDVSHLRSSCKCKGLSDHEIYVLTSGVSLVFSSGYLAWPAELELGSAELHPHEGCTQHITDHDDVPQGGR